MVVPVENPYVQYGCGLSAIEGWFNFDNSPTLRIERIPLLGKILTQLSGNEQRFPEAVLYGDICKGLPIYNETARGVYASHVLEHLSLEDFRTAVASTFRMLAPGGIFRLIVPDLEARARIYLQQVERRSPHASNWFMRAARLGIESKPRTILQHARRMFGNSAHLWMWDEYSISAELDRAGFVKIRRCNIGDSLDPSFAKVEDPSRFYDAEDDIRECAMEACKPFKS
jgi:predicted SAM-dependent methyltransferase